MGFKGREEDDGVDDEDDGVGGLAQALRKEEQVGRHKEGWMVQSDEAQGFVLQTKPSSTLSLQPSRIQHRFIVLSRPDCYTLTLSIHLVITHYTVALSRY